MLAINYETWDWNNFQLEELGETAVVLTLVEGSYWTKYTRNADGFWNDDDDPDGSWLEDYELEEFILEDVGPEEYTVIAPHGLMSRKEKDNGNG